MISLKVRRTVSVIAVLLGSTLLAACGTGAPAPQPSPTNSGALDSDDGGTGGLDHGWIVTGTTQYMTASNRICAWQPVLPTTPEEFAVGWNGTMNFNLYLDGGYPDSWHPSDPAYPSLPDTFHLDFSDGTWEGHHSIGTAGTVGYTYWQTFGEFTTELDADGRLLGGTGTGDTFHNVTPDIAENLSENLTFTVEPAPDAPWCGEAEAAWGG